jgi:hypothetical protein
MDRKIAPNIPANLRYTALEREKRRAGFRARVRAISRVKTYRPTIFPTSGKWSATSAAS